MAELSGVIAAFERMVDERLGRLQVEVASARPVLFGPVDEDRRRALGIRQERQPVRHARMAASWTDREVLVFDRRGLDVRGADQVAEHQAHVAALLSADADELDAAAFATEERFQCELEVHLVPRVDLFADDRNLPRIRPEVLTHDDAELRFRLGLRLDRGLKEAREDLPELAQLLIHDQTLPAAEALPADARR